MKTRHAMNVGLAAVLFTAAMLASPISQSSAESPITRPAEQGVAVDQSEQSDPVTPTMLDRRLPELRFDMVAFADVIDFLRDVTSSNFSVDWKAIEEAGISKNTPISIRLRDVKYRIALENILAQLGDGTLVTYELKNSVITITTGGKPVEKTYDVRFIAAWRVPATQPGAKAAEPLDLLTRMLYGSVAPASWKVHGGKAELKESNGLLVITTSPKNHEAIANLIDNLKRITR
jgi:hypothetical protein